MKFTIPIRLPSLTNARLSNGASMRLKSSQRGATRYCMLYKVIPPMPLVVTIVRVGPRRLDDDNLAAACKHVRDQIAAEVGVDDGSDQYTWKYEQRIDAHKVMGKFHHYSVDVIMETREDD